MSRKMQMRNGAPAPFQHPGGCPCWECEHRRHLISTRITINKRHEEDDE